LDENTAANCSLNKITDDQSTSDLLIQKTHESGLKKTALILSAV